MVILADGTKVEPEDTVNAVHERLALIDWVPAPENMMVSPDVVSVEMEYWAVRSLAEPVWVT